MHGRSRRAWEVTVGMVSIGSHGESRRVTAGTVSLGEACIGTHADANAARGYARVPMQPAENHFKRARES